MKIKPQEIAFYDQNVKNIIFEKLLLPNDNNRINGYW